MENNSKEPIVSALKNTMEISTSEPIGVALENTMEISASEPGSSTVQSKKRRPGRPPKAKTDSPQQPSKVQRRTRPSGCRKSPRQISAPSLVPAAAPSQRRGSGRAPRRGPRRNTPVNVTQDFEELKRNFETFQATIAEVLTTLLAGTASFHSTLLQAIQSLEEALTVVATPNSFVPQPMEEETPNTEVPNDEGMKAMVTEEVQPEEVDPMATEASVEVQVDALAKAHAVQMEAAAQSPGKEQGEEEPWKIEDSI